MLSAYLLVFAVAAVSAALLTPLSVWLGRRLGMVDWPGGRRHHEGGVPRLGGLALFVAFVVAIAFAAWRGVLTIGYSPDDYTRLAGLMIGGLGAFLLGLLDDRCDLAPRIQLLGQVPLALIAVATMLVLERFTLPFLGYVELGAYEWGIWVYAPLTVFWIVGMMNTVNWLDGLDGLAVGVGAILCIVLVIHMHRVGQGSVALLPLALLGAASGFLPFNFFPARVFMGSAGAFFLGYALGALGLIAGGRIATVLLVLGIPIVDVAWQILDRLRRRRSPTEADRGHLHFRLVDLGLSQRAIVLVYWGLCALFGLLALLVASRLWKLVALLALGGVVVVVLVLLSRRSPGDGP